MVTILFSSGKRYYPAALRMVSEHTDDDPVITHIKDNILVSSFSVVIVKYIQEQQNHHEISYLSISQRSRKAGRHSSTYVFVFSLFQQM